MIIFQNIKNNNFIVFDTEIQNDAENSVLWVSDIQVDYYLRPSSLFDYSKEWWDKVVKPCSPRWDLCMVDYLGGDDANAKLIEIYVNYWKNREPFKSFCC